MCTEFSPENLKVQETLQNLRKLKLKLNLNNNGGRVWVDSSASGQGKMVGFCEHRYELSGPMSDCWLLKNCAQI
jgi:hypothetical protein